MAEEVVASPQLLPLRRRTQAKRLRKTHVTQDSDSEGDTAIDDVEVLRGVAMQQLLWFGMQPATSMAMTCHK